MNFEELSEESTKDLKSSFDYQKNDYEKKAEKDIAYQVMKSVASQTVQKMSFSKKITTLILSLFLFYSLALGFISLAKFIYSIFLLIF
jgi:hypothetical protein